MCILENKTAYARAYARARYTCACVAGARRARARGGVYAGAPSRVTRNRFLATRPIIHDELRRGACRVTLGFKTSITSCSPDPLGSACAGVCLRAARGVEAALNYLRARRPPFRALPRGFHPRQTTAPHSNTVSRDRKGCCRPNPQRRAEGVLATPAPASRTPPRVFTGHATG